MRVLFITKGDFIGKQNEGGLACRFRNYYLLQKTVGKDKVYVCAVVSNKKENQENIKYIYDKQTLIGRYINYISKRDGISKRTEQEIVNYIWEIKPDCIFYDGSTWGNIAEKINNKENAIVFFHNIERQYTFDRVKKGNMLCMLRYWATCKCERKQVEYVKKCICLNERENNLLKEYYSREADLILPITFSDSWKAGECDNQREEFLLFVGSYFDANVRGIKWFVKEVMPHIDFDIKIVGKGMERLKGKHFLKNVSRVEVIGGVDNLAPYYKKAAAVIMPIFMGGGMKVKTAEALMNGKTIFGSKEAFEGYEFDGISGLNLCEDKEAFINAINDFKIREHTNFNFDIRKLFLEKYETDAYIKKMHLLFKAEGRVKVGYER